MSEALDLFVGHDLRVTSPDRVPERRLQPAGTIPDDAPRPLPELVEWLRHSPNNPTYLDSPAYLLPDAWLQQNEHAIASLLETGVASLNFDHATSDLDRLAALRSGEESGMFVAYDIAYAGIKEIVDKFHQTSTESTREEVNNRAILAIGATMLRAEYMKRLAASHPEILTPRGEVPFSDTYRQNIVSAIRRATQLQTRAQPSPETPELRLVTPEE